MQKETKEMVCACGISFLAGVLITLIIFGCASHMHHHKMPKHESCPFAKMMNKENQFKHHNKLMGRPQENVLVVVPEAPTTPQPQAQ